MEFAPGAITLDDIVGGVLQVGEVPLPRILRRETTFENAAGRTLGGALGIIMTGVLADCEIGDRIAVWFSAEVVKGGAGDTTELTVEQSGGTGTIVFNNDELILYNSSWVNAAALWGVSWAFLVKCTVAGSPIMRFDGRSLTADSTIALGKAQCVAWIYPGS